MVGVASLSGIVASPAAGQELCVPGVEIPTARVKKASRVNGSSLKFPRFRVVSQSGTTCSYPAGCVNSGLLGNNADAFDFDQKPNPPLVLEERECE